MSRGSDRSDRDLAERRQLWVPSTWLWLARICSISVDPERGSPTMKIGASDSKPFAGVLLEELAAEYLGNLLMPRLESHGIVRYERPLPLVAGLVVLPGPVVISRIFVSLAECKSEMDVGTLAEVLALQLLLPSP